MHNSAPHPSSVFLQREGSTIQVGRQNYNFISISMDAHTHTYIYIYRAHSHVHLDPSRHQTTILPSHQISEQLSHDDT